MSVSQMLFKEVLVNPNKIIHQCEELLNCAQSVRSQVYIKELGAI